MMSGKKGKGDKTKVSLKSKFAEKMGFRGKVVSKEACNLNSMKAAILIQRWFRLWKARLEARRNVTWKIFTSLEYANEADQLKLYDFFTTIITQMTHEDSSGNIGAFDQPISIEKKLMDATKRQSSLGSLYEEDISVYKAANVENICIEEDYIGPIIKLPVTEDCLTSIIDAFKRDERLHPKYLVLLLLETRSFLKTLSNINRCNIDAMSGDVGEVTIVGDLHGQLEDLLTIFYKNGLPSKSNWYIFNGDFVDRGPNSVEVATIIFASLLCYPRQVFVNRGNHEDHIVNIRYGFVKEVMQKYPEYATEIIETFTDLFSWLPLATIIDKKILVLHGGFSDHCSIDKLEQIDRHKYLSALKPSLNEDVLKDLLTKHDAPELFEWRLILDTLWSDPKKNLGCKPNLHRGGGCYFGPDITEKFLNDNDLKLLVRSHECKSNGYEYAHNSKVLTIFSASNYYSRGSNKGAYAKIVKTGDLMQRKIVQFVALRQAVAAENSLEKTSIVGMETQALSELRKLINARKATLLKGFREKDPNDTKQVSMNDWVEVIEGTLRLSLPWRALARQLTTVVEDLVNYSDLYDETTSRPTSITSEDNVMETLYTNKENLETIFRLLDKDKSGKLSFEEFERGCMLMATHTGHPIDEEIIHSLALSMDKNEDGEIDLNEFMEALRLIEQTGSRYKM